MVVGINPVVAGCPYSWVNTRCVNDGRISTYQYRWPSCPYMVKTFRNFLLQDRLPYDPETWHAKLGPKLHKFCIRGDPRLTLTYFTAR